MSNKWFIIWIFSIFLFGYAQESKVSISFNELETFIMQNSPQIKMIKQEFKLKETEKRLDLQWSNPELGYSFEEIEGGGENEKEQVFVLTKNMELPWIYLKNKKYWNDVIQSESHKKEAKLRAFIAEMKSGYLQIGIMSAQKKYLNKVKSEVENILQVSGNQYKEGAISGLEQQLIKMALFNLNTTLLELTQTQQHLENDWKTKAGIDISKQIEIASQVKFKPVDIESIIDIDEIVKTNPGMLAKNQYGLALKKQIGIEKLRILPELSFTGGYKKVNENIKGYVLEFSLPIPLLNFNRPQIQKQKIELNNHNYETQMYNNQLLTAIQEYMQAINSYKNMLQETENPLDSSNEEFEKFKISYKEGWISLNDLLNSIELYSSYIQNYNQELLSYYDYLLKLEAITGKSLVTI
ncbi:MAG: TolC family protein [Calditrichia bacterium]|nr:TolC family protein [Calditrichia bacterium]